MIEQKIKGIVIGSKDFKESDKIVSLFTLEKGIVYAKLVGVKKPKAKLKCAKEIFCFAEFDLVSKKGDFSTVTSANIIETFHNITLDLDKFYAGCYILEILKTVGQENEPNEALFLEILKSFGTLAYEKVSPNVVKLRFLIKIFEAMGYRLSLEKCACCGEDFFHKRFFTWEDGAIVCNNCKMINSEEISPLIHTTMRLAGQTPNDKLGSLKLNEQGVLSALNLLERNFQARFDKKLNL